MKRDTATGPSESRLAGFSHRLLDLLFPLRCVSCGSAGAALCSACMAGIERIPDGQCAACSARLRPEARGVCAPCAARTPSLDGVYALAFARGPMMKAIHALKYRGQTSVAEPLGALLAEWWAGHALTADILLPVPLHPRRERQRGYNQSALLAKEFGRHIGLRVAPQMLERVKDTRPQVGLNAPARRQNMADAFHASNDLTGLRVLLLDDVATTGATMEAAASALRAAGAAGVVGLSLAHALPGVDPGI